MRTAGIMLVAAALASCTRVEQRAAAPRPVVPETPPKAAVSTRTPSSRSFHDFRPSIHGFQFRNGFQGSFFGTGESAYGLCGGMSFAAADYFIADREIPRDMHAPADGTPLYTYIYQRQASSFGTLGAMGLKFVEWMQLPDDGQDSAHSRTLAELPFITAALSRGEPVVLGLVLASTKDKGKAWDNHQVLAFNAAEPAPGRTEVRIYDPNFPGRDDITISITREPARIAMHIPGRRDLPIRGVFRMAYSPASPP